MCNEQERGLETNRAELTGEIISDLIFSHKSYGEIFYEVLVGVDRKSGYRDEIKVLVSERIVWELNIKRGTIVRVIGQIRTYNEEEDGRSRLNIVVFAREMETPFESEDEGSSLDMPIEHENNIFLDGFLCKRPIRRTSPLGREICDIMLAVNRMYNKSDYIPCIAWGRNAAYAGSLDVGTRMAVTGRIQSREYKKRCDDGSSLSKVAYEVSLVKIEEL